MLEKFDDGQTRFENRVAFALSDLALSGLLHRPHRGYYRLTQQGKDISPDNVLGFVKETLKERDRKKRKGQRKKIAAKVDAPAPQINDDRDIDDSRTGGPDEHIETLYQSLNDMLAKQLLEKVKKVSPESFEALVLRLLEQMGYGDGRLTRQGPDDGIDGIINQDALGLEKVYVQAKRWDGPVGSNPISNFAGSLDRAGAHKGVFITSSSFNTNAVKAAEDISKGNKFIRLIDGQELTRLMIKHDIGVVPQRGIVLKKLDENYFAESGGTGATLPLAPTRQSQLFHPPAPLFGYE